MVSAASLRLMVLRGMERALRIGARQDARAIELVDLAANLSVAFTSGIALSATVLTALFSSAPWKMLDELAARDRCIHLRLGVIRVAFR